MLRRSIIGLGMLFCCSFCFAQSSVSISKKIERILRRSHHDINIGIIARDARSGKILYQKHANRNFIPASNMKLFTALAALDALGPDYRYKTQLFKSGKDFYIQFVGDPSLKTTDLDALLAGLPQLSYQTIKGNLYLDTHRFDDKHQGPGWMWDDQHFCFSAPISALMLDHNCYYFRVNRASRRDHYYLSNANPYLRFENLTHAKRKKQTTCKHQIKVEQDKVTLSGCVSAQDEALKTAIIEPEHYTKIMLRKILKAHHIILKGQIKSAKTPENARPISAHYSATVASLSQGLLKNSDNLIAESFVKTIGFMSNGEAGSWKSGRHAIKKILSKYLTLGHASLSDGSGGSRYNLVTPKQMSELLFKTYHNFNYAYEFISALPIAGIDGTLHDRMKTINLKHHLRAKTGTMTNVSALSGFLETPKKHIIIFSIMMNNVPVHSAQLKKLEEKIVLALSHLDVK